MEQDITNYQWKQQESNRIKERRAMNSPTHTTRFFSVVFYFLYEQEDQFLGIQILFEYAVSTLRTWDN